MTSLDVATHPELTETLNLLTKRPRTLTLEAVAEGANVSFGWLSQFARNKIPDPSFNRVMRVRDFLRKQATEAKE
ncbi:putative helix-turn-helix domain protein [Xanthomonas phage Pfeifenkraut]|uniref:Helix-turn-helix domain protein n=1 Tax=Xanthomonas phage Pfeifenkraut TaxID=2939132 RepID=A0A9E7E1N6_9CAUD|nr:putative helix-turn-helix domain protein [Xanthomonas phage Pfeifenkraut]URA06963.1 putative helix-turn-helix domain protein [Xanthomonas phage Pfeifenkraut]